MPAREEGAVVRARNETGRESPRDVWKADALAVSYFIRSLLLLAASLINCSMENATGFDMEDTIDMDMEESEEYGLHELAIYEVVFWCIMYGVVALLAVGGNALVIFIITTRPRMQTVTNYFIVNLAVGDMITGLLAIPFKFQAALFQRWFFPDFFCQLVPFIETVSLSVSVFTLTGSAVDRFRAVIFPKDAKMTQHTARVIVVFIWGFSLIGSLPYGMFHKVYDLAEEFEGFNESHYQCRPMFPDQDWWKGYNVYLTIIQYFVPLFIVDGAYTVIAVKVWLTPPLVDVRSDPRSALFEASKRRVVKMLVIVVAVFTFCWLPLETYLVLNELRPRVNEWYYINLVYFCCHWLAMSNSCLNPIIYGIYNEKFQREYKRVYLRLRCKKQYEGVATSDNEMTATFVGENEENGSVSNLNTPVNRSLMSSPSHLNKYASWSKALSGAHDYIASELGHD
uniref:G-protein coupled receptors family 1 profile domain-containing protein n=1 Tax=Plectus sambesii TaxID=2011161 RepID=A0A914UME1_9BILA